jgi:hypothetical protein
MDSYYVLCLYECPVHVRCRLHVKLQYSLFLFILVIRVNTKEGWWFIIVRHLLLATVLAQVRLHVFSLTALWSPRRTELHSKYNVGKSTLPCDLCVRSLNCSDLPLSKHCIQTDRQTDIFKNICVSLLKIEILTSFSAIMEIEKVT